MKRVLALLLISWSANAQIIAPEFQRQTDLSDNGINVQCTLYALSTASAYGSTLLNPTIPRDAVINTMTARLIETFRVDERFKAYEPEILSRLVQAGVIQGSLLAGDESITGPIATNEIRTQSTFVGNVVQEQCVLDLRQFRTPRQRSNGISI